MSKAPQFQFNAVVFQRADDILNNVWQLVEPATSRALTKTAWKARFRAVARDLAELKRTDDEISNAYRSVCERTGLAVWSLRLIQDEILRLDVSKEAGDDYALYQGEG